MYSVVHAKSIKLCRAHTVKHAMSSQYKHGSSLNKKQKNNKKKLLYKYV